MIFSLDILLLMCYNSYTNPARGRGFDIPSRACAHHHLIAEIKAANAVSAMIINSIIS